MFRITSPVALFSYALIIRILRSISIASLAGTQLLVTGSTLVAPLIGYFASTTTCISLYFIRTLLIFSGHLPFAGSLVYLPTLAGSITLSTQSRIYEVTISLTCMALFLLHPVGQTSFLYASYWLLPVFFSFVKNRTIGMRAISSTFITHAVGSTIYLYTHATDSLFWHALIPQVWIERMTHALVLTLCYYACSWIAMSINQQYAKGVTCLEQ